MKNLLLASAVRLRHATPHGSLQPRSAAVAAALAVFLLSRPALAVEINPDPGSGEVTALALTQSVPGGTTNDPLVRLPGRDSYRIEPDRTGMISISGAITHTLTGAITTKLRDANGTEIASATGNTPGFSFPPLKFRAPFHWTVYSPDGDPIHDSLLITGRSGYRDGPGFTGRTITHNPDPADDGEEHIPYENDEADHGEDDLSGRDPCGGCDSCDLTNSEHGSSLDASGDNGRFHGSFPAGTSMQGDSSTSVDYEIDPSQGVSRASFKVRSTGDATVTRDAGGLTSITTGSCHVSFTTQSGKVEIDFSKPTGGDPYRHLTFENIAAGQVKLTSVFSARSVETIWRHYPAASPERWELVMGNGARKMIVTRADDGTDPNLRIERHQLFERAAQATGEAAVKVADVRKTFSKTLLGWRKTQVEVLNGAGQAALTTQWTYFGPAAGPYQAGLLASTSRPGGATASHDYYFESQGNCYYHTITTPFADGIASLVEIRHWHSTDTGSSSGRTLNVGTNHLKLESDSWNGSTLTCGIWDGTEYLNTIYTCTAFGSDFGGRPTSIAHPDGTGSTQSFSRTGAPPTNASSRNLLITRGAMNGGTVNQGLRIETTRDRNGVLILMQTTAIGTGSGILLDSVGVAQADPLGRPLTITHFIGPNAWTTTRTWSCCGLATETDRFGVTTSYHHDDLGRLVKSHRLGVTTESKYDGLSVHTYRYPENPFTTVPLGNDSNRIARRTRDLPALTALSESPDPSSPGAGSLTPTVTATSYTGNLAATTTTVGGTVTVANGAITVQGGHSQSTSAHPDGRTYQSTGDLAPSERHTYSVNATGLLVTRAYLVDGNTVESASTQFDGLGRTKKVTKGTIVINHDYATVGATPVARVGKLVRTTDSDGVKTLYDYNSKGERTTTALKLDNENTITYGTDQIAFTETVPAQSNNSDVLLTTNKVWYRNEQNQVIETTVATTARSPDGLKTWSWQIGRGTTFSATIINPQTAGAWTETTTRPDGTSTVATYTNGRLASEARYASGGGNPITTTTYGYEDGTNGLPRRLITSNDSRTGTTTTSYISATCDQVASVTDPGSRTTAYTYDTRGRRLSATIDGSTTNYSYYPDGQIKARWGGQAYPVFHVYDHAGRIKTLHTWRSAPAITQTTNTPPTGSAVTTWVYYNNTGLLNEKLDHSNKGPLYTYTAAGRLLTRTWERNVTTSYGHDAGGRLVTTTYSDDTPDVSITYDALGRQQTITQNLQSKLTYTYTADLGVDTETIEYDINHDGTFDFSRILDRKDRSLGRDTGWDLKQTGGSIETTAAYSYDAAGRVGTVASAADTFTYGYTYAQSGTGPRVGATSGENLKPDFMPYTLTKSGSPALQAVRTYEATREVLDVIENTAGTTTRSKYDYTVNAIGQRTGLTTSFTLGGPSSNPGSTSWGYDALGQVVSADAPGGSAADRGYLYDVIGNRYGQQVGATSVPIQSPNAGTTTYRANYEPGANPLNQYDDIRTPAQRPSGWVVAHDVDGNLTYGTVPGVPTTTPGPAEPVRGWLHWDAENRLVHAEADNSYGQDTMNYRYDAFGRLIWIVGDGTGAPGTVYLYDGWNRIAEFARTWNGSTYVVSLARTYLWGLDLSGSFQGAGGVGGMLSMTIYGTLPGTVYPTYDGNGNISEYLNADGSVSAHFEYDPFGNTTISTDTTNTYPYRFSTKPIDLVTGLYYYGYRWYDPLTGRWPSRDPIWEAGGLHLYAFLENDGVNQADLWGLALSWVGNSIHVSDDIGYCCTELGERVPMEHDDCGQSCCPWEMGEFQVRVSVPKTSLRSQILKQLLEGVPHDQIGTFEHPVSSGHAFIYFPGTGAGAGFYPQEFRGRPGLLKRDDTHSATHSKSYKACPETMRRIRESILRDKGRDLEGGVSESKTNYDILDPYRELLGLDPPGPGGSATCLSWVRDRLLECGCNDTALDVTEPYFIPGRPGFVPR